MRNIPYAGSTLPRWPRPLGNKEDPEDMRSDTSKKISSQAKPFTVKAELMHA
jgi:hypothetical protein